VELEDRTTTPNDDPRWSAMRSAPAAAKPDSARRWLAAVTYGGRRGEQRRSEHMAGFGTHGVDEATTASDNAVGTGGL
jgi:hypothetical protein